MNCRIRLLYGNDKPNIWLQSPVNSGANLKFLPFCRSPAACLFSSWPESSSKALSKLISCRVTSLSSSSLSVTEYNGITSPSYSLFWHRVTTLYAVSLTTIFWRRSKSGRDLHATKATSNVLLDWVREKNVARGYDVRTSRTKKQIFYRQAPRNILSDNLCSSFPSFLLLVRSSRVRAAFSGPAHEISSSPDTRILV